MNTIILTLMMAMCFTSMSLAQNNFLQKSWPEKSDALHWAPLPYSIVKLLFWDAEKFINETLGLSSQSCQYSSLRTKTTYSHKEIGACTYHHLIDSMYSKELQPAVYIWALNKDNKAVTLKMDWRPHKGSLYEIINQFLEMKYEKNIEMNRKIWSYVLRTEIEPTSYKKTDTLVGEISFLFKMSPELSENLKTVFPNYLQLIAPDISEIKVNMKPDGRSKHYSQSIVELQVFPPNADHYIYGEIKTNINLLNTKRSFNATGTVITKESNNEL